MNRKAKKALLGAVFAALLIGQNAAFGDGLGRRLEGVWLFDITTVNCQTGAAIATLPTLHTYLPGGSMLSEPAVSPAVLRTGHGVWEHVAGGTFRNTIKLLRFNPDGTYAGMVTVTRDIDAAFPARAAEEFGWNIVALLHATEIPVPGSLPRCIRLLVHAYTKRSRAEIRHCYLRGATVLRPDRA